MSQNRNFLRRVVPSLPLTLTIIVFWLLMTDSFNLGQALLGLLLGLVVPLFAARLDREFARIGSLRPLPKLIATVLWDILVSNVRVAIQVLGPEKRLHPGFIWVPLDIGNIHGIAALTSLITLTPGTVSAALSDDRRYLLVHVLNLADEDRAGRRDQDALRGTADGDLPMTGNMFIDTSIVVCMHMVGVPCCWRCGGCCAGRPCPTASLRWTRSR
jgi:Multisubunit Na+/H+ antiporter, MnhE subunit